MAHSLGPALAVHSEVSGGRRQHEILDDLWIGHRSAVGDGDDRLHHLAAIADAVLE